MIKPALLVFLGGGVGSAIRYLISRISFNLYAGNFPLATLIANGLSCFLLAFLLYFFYDKNNIQATNLNYLLLIGFCGGMSTFSTFSYETAQLLKQGNMGFAVLNVALSLAIGIGAIFFIYYKTKP